ncbi:hypothetical protein [Nevskia sp.]|uniref:lysophospholipid acyltransferase family protein n=1 Tax=Nevskia sp. TaxID=1929292 RepID=UPI0025F7CAA7|nr:hypothetical protein [Nevskia sp.]
MLGLMPLPALRMLGLVLGALLVRLPNRYRTITRLHLLRCLPDIPASERLQIERSSLIASAQAIFEAPAIWFGPLARRQRWIVASPEQLAIIRDAQRPGHGVIMLTPHQGAWELASFFCAQIAPITVLYKPQKGAADTVIRDGRARGAKVTPVPTTGAGVKALLAALKAGDMVGILPDHDPPEGSGTVFAPLFGIPANTMDLVTKLAARTGAPVLYVIAERRPWAQGFRFHVLTAPSGIADPQHGPAALNAGLETCIRLLPSQYWWSYRRYRRRPVGEAGFYHPNA